jgi:hypothetical protein
VKEEGGTTTTTTTIEGTGNNAKRRGDIVLMYSILARTRNLKLEREIEKKRDDGVIATEIVTVIEDTAMITEIVLMMSKSMVALGRRIDIRDNVIVTVNIA